MNVKLSVFGKGMVLVAIPFLAQSVFLGVLLLVRADLDAAQQLALHTQKVLARAENAFRLVIESETHLLGYALTGDEPLARQYQQTRAAATRAIAEVEDEVADNTAQAERAEVIRRKTDEYLAWLDEAHRLMLEDNRQEVVARIRSQGGMNRLRELRMLTDTFLHEEERLFEERRQRLEEAEQMQNWALLAGVGLAVGSGLVLVLVYSNSIAWRLAVLTENTHRLAEGLELAPRLGGDDELGQLDHVFHDMADALHQKDQENELFVYSVSHDLRSPLVNLQGFSQELATVSRELRELLAQSALPEPAERRVRTLLDRDVTEAVSYIQSAVARLAAIIDALLRLSRAGRVEYRWQMVDVSVAVRRVVHSLGDSIGRKGAEVVVAELPPAWADPTAVEQIFGNLLANAVQYLAPTRPGRIEVGSAPADGTRAAPGQRVYFVRDNGLGIPAEFQDKVFVAFQRLHPEVVPGEGIGLALVRRVVERHGGRIWVESETGTGSTFYVSLPSGPPISEGSAPGGTLGMVAGARAALTRSGERKVAS